MKQTVRRIQNTYLALVAGNTLAASFIWGVNTIFLLDAGLSNFEAFAANAFFTAGMVLFEVPTGVVADTRGRRASYMLGALTLGVGTLLYVFLWQMTAPFWLWAVVSLVLGLGFTFFSGALEAWLVDALHSVGVTEGLERVFGRAQVANGIAMLIGSAAGGYVAQLTNLGVPYVIRSVLLFITLVIAFVYMKDLGFKPARSAHPLKDVKNLLHLSIENGFRNPPVRWLMLAAPFAGGVGIYAFYAMQPYLLELYGNEKAYGIAGLVAAIVAGAQIAGGMLAPRIRNLFKRRTSALIAGTLMSAVALLLSGLFGSFSLVIMMLVVWGLMFAALMPIRQAYLNGLIESRNRATVLSFDSLMSSAGGVVIQPGLGKVADLQGYGASFVVAAAMEAAAVPFLIRAKFEKTGNDVVVKEK